MVARSWWQALSTGMSEAETSTHLESASASHRGAAARLLHQSKLQWRLRRKGQTPSCRCLVEVPAADTTTHFASTSASHRGAAASFHQSELSSWRLHVHRKGQAPSCRCLVEVPAADTSTHLAFTSASHRGAAASLLLQSELALRLRRKRQTPSCRCLVGVPAADTSTSLVSSPPPRTEEQPQACSVNLSLTGGAVTKANNILQVPGQGAGGRHEHAP